jgi:hypothetical protein
MSAVPVLEFKAGRYFAGVAFVYGAHDRDWLGAIWRDRPEQPWTFTYRFRVYVDEKVHDSADPRDVYRMTIDQTATDDGAIACLRAAAEALIRRGYNDRHDVVDIRSSDPLVAMQALARYPWANIRSERGGGVSS